MQGSQFGRALEFGDYVAFAKRRWRWIALGLVLGVLAGAVYLQVAPKTYTSTAKVLVYATTSDTETENGITNSGVNLDTEAQIVRSVDVAASVADTLDADADPVDLAKKVSVTVPANTTVLEISFDGSTPERAQAGASAFATAYLENRADVAQDAIDAEIANLRDRMDDLSDELSEVSEELSVTVASNERAVLRTRRNQLTTELQSLNATLSPLEGSVQTPGRVIVGAQTPESATSPRPYLVMVSTALLGFLGALGLALLREKLDRRPHTAHDLERFYGLPVMSEVRVLNTVTGVAEAPVTEVRALYHAMIASYAGSTRSVLVCGPSDQSSARAVGTTLAVLAAQTGTTTVHVGNSDPGDSRLTSEQRDIDRRGVLARRDFSSLGLIRSGELRHRQIRPVLDGLESEYDLCVLELPTGDAAFDLPLVGRHVDLVLIVVELDHSSRSEMEAVVDDIQKVGATEVAGVAVRRARRRRRFGRERTVAHDTDVASAYESEWRTRDDDDTLGPDDDEEDPGAPEDTADDAGDDSAGKRPWFARRGA